MTALQLNTEILRELSLINTDETLMKKVLNYIRKITAKKEDPTLMTREELYSIIKKGEEEYRQGKTVRLMPGESVTEMLRRTNAV